MSIYSQFTANRSTGSYLGPDKPIGGTLRVSIYSQFTVKCSTGSHLSPDKPIGPSTWRCVQVFGPFAPQEEVFEETGRPMVDEVLQGFNATIFACALAPEPVCIDIPGSPVHKRSRLLDETICVHPETALWLTVLGAPCKNADAVCTQVGFRLDCASIKTTLTPESPQSYATGKR